MFLWILNIVESGSYTGIFFLMFLENLFPPIPSELIVPLAGYLAREGQFDIFLVILVSGAGTVLGLFPWYLLGRFFSVARIKKLAKRFGRVVTLSGSDIDFANTWFNKYGFKAVFFGRVVPTIRTLISVPAGIIKMPVLPFLLYSFLGSLLWISGLAGLGFVLSDHYKKVENYLDPASNLVVISIVGIYIYRVITFKNDEGEEMEKEEGEKR